MMRRTRLVVALCLLSAGHCLAAEEAGKSYGQFVLKTDAENAYLPSSLRFKDLPDVELLDPKIGLSLSFTDYEFRNKFYREESRYAWEGREDPRFVTDVDGGVAVTAESEGDLTGETVRYASSLAKVERSLLFRKDRPVMRIVYSLTATRDIMIHMPDMFCVGMRLSDAFVLSQMLDARNPAGTPHSFAGNSASRQLCNMGPIALSNEDGSVSVLVSHTVGGDLPSPLPYRMIEVKKGTQITFSITAELFRKDPDRMFARMRELYAAMPASKKAGQLCNTGYHVLYREKKEAEGEGLLLQAAEAAKDWYKPYMMIAEYRLQNKVEGVVRGVTKGQMYHEGAFRMPWHAGCILRGGDYLADERLSADQQDLLAFNLLSAIENDLFYADSYSWTTRTFMGRKMFAQACAVNRQALWAVENFPVSEKTREKHRKGFKKAIADLEKKLLAPKVEGEVAEVADTGALLDKPSAENRLLLLKRMGHAEAAPRNPKVFVELAVQLAHWKLYAHACAQYRQALWALEQGEEDDAQRAKMRADYAEAIADLEKTLLSEMTTVAPMPIEVRPDPEMRWNQCDNDDQTGGV